MLDCTNIFVCGFQNTKLGTTKDKTLLAGGWKGGLPITVTELLCITVYILCITLYIIVNSEQCMDMEKFVSRLQLGLHNIYSYARIHRKRKAQSQYNNSAYNQGHDFLTEGVGG